MKKLKRKISMFAMLLAMHPVAEIFANELPPIGERVYMGDGQGKFGSLEIKKRSSSGWKKSPSSVIFRDPEMDSSKVGESHKTTVMTQGKSEYAGDEKDKSRRKARNELEEGNQQDNALNRNKKSILDLGAIKISGRHKQPNIPFNRIPIHLEQSFEPLNNQFLNRIDENKLPGL